MMRSEPATTPSAWRIGGLILPVLLSPWTLDPGAEAPGAQGGATAITGVAVVTMTDAGVLPDRTVVLRGGVVESIDSGGSSEIPPGAEIVDGEGGYLIPGLVDAHVHLMEEGDLGRFLFHGVTTVRQLTGSERVLRWREAVDDGRIVGPRIVTSGPLFAGPEIPWEDKVVPADPAAARREVRRQREAGYDLIKIYDGLSADVYRAVVDEAASAGTRLTGHIPREVGLAGVLEAGQDLEHTDKMLMDVWGHDLDPARIDSVAGAIRDAGVFVTPTLASMEQLARVRTGGFDSLLTRPRALRVGPETLSFWCSVTARLRADREPAQGVRFDPFADFQQEIVRGLQRAGVPLVAGTDYPNAMLPPGAGLLDELDALTRAGLSPAEALTAATRVAALALDDPRSGHVAPGARADLVLLRENPLEDLDALRSIRGVAVRGRWLRRPDLERLAPERSTTPACEG